MVKVGLAVPKPVALARPTWPMGMFFFVAE
jgi:hypothetical protein